MQPPTEVNDRQSFIKYAQQLTRHIGDIARKMKVVVEARLPKKAKKEIAYGKEVIGPEDRRYKEAFHTSLTSFLGWLSTRLPKQARVVGSSVAFLMNPKLGVPGDIDVWVNKNVSTEKFHDALYKAGWDFNNSYEPTNATMSPYVKNVMNYKNGSYPFELQIITVDKINVEDVVDDFDLDVAEGIWDPRDNNTNSTKPEVVQAIMNQVATFNPRHWDLVVQEGLSFKLTNRALNRIIKYRGKGFIVSVDPTSPTKITNRMVDKWIAEMSQNDENDNEGFYYTSSNETLAREIIKILRYQEQIRRDQVLRRVMFDMFQAVRLESAMKNPHTPAEKQLRDAARDFKDEYIRRGLRNDPVNDDIRKHFFDIDELELLLNEVFVLWWKYARDLAQFKPHRIVEHVYHPDPNSDEGVDEMVEYLLMKELIDEEEADNMRNRV